MFPQTKWVSAAASHPTAFEVAYKAWQTAYAKGYTKKHLFVYIDFTKPATQPRFFVYDVDAHKIILSTYTSHGIRSGAGIYATHFSNKNGSKETSIGVEITKEVYQGKKGRVLRIAGLEKWNDNAFSRYIEIHPAKYVEYGRAGHSWGCYALPRSVFPTAFKLIQTGTIVVSYYPDANWLNNSSFL